MSKTIDERIISMQFDNKHFESNVKTSMNTLDKLKQKLSFKDGSKGLENLGTAAKNVDMKSLSSGVETVRARFSALEVMGVTALANITNAAVNAGMRIVKALTIDPVMDGFQEYEMTLNAVQTTMAGTGKTAEEVEKELKKLDEYADKTVYSTADMLNNLPKFTNAGVDLEKATTAMIGIANATAHAGGDAGKASIAFYNLGQAIGTGYLTRMDYNSINNAGIATMEWKEQMVDAAIAAGTLKKAEDGLYEAGGKTFTLQQLFIDGLQHQWATTDVMMKVFGDYGDETTEIGKKATQSATQIKTFTMMMDSLKATAGTGWKETWQNIFGGLDDAKVFWTGLNDFISGIITTVADYRNKILEVAFDNPFTKVLNKVNEVTKSTKAAVKNVKDLGDMVDRVLRGEFGNQGDNGDKDYRRKLVEAAGYDYAEVQNAVNEKLGVSTRLTAKAAESQEELNKQTAQSVDELLKLSDAELKKIGLTEEEIKTLRIWQKEAKASGKTVDELISDMDKMSGRQHLLEGFKNIGQGISQALKAIGSAWTEIFPPEATAIKLFNLFKGFHELTERLKMSDETADKLKRTFKGVFALLDIGAQIIKALFKGFGMLVSYIAPAGEGLLGFTAGVGDLIVNLDEAIKTSNIFTKIIEYIGRFLKPVADGVKFVANAISDSFADIANKAETRFEPLGALGRLVMGVFMGLGKVIQAVAPWLAKAASGIGSAVSGLMNDIADAIQNADYEKLFDILNGGIMSAMGIFIAKFIKGGSDLLGNAGGFLENINNVLGGVGDALGAFTQSIKADILKKIATAIAILAAALLVISLIDSEKLTSSLESVTLMLLELMGAMALFGKISGGKGLKDMLGMYVMASAMKTLANSLLVLAVALKIMSTMSPEAMGVALTTMSVGLGELVGAVYLMSLMPDSKVQKSAKAVKKLSTSLLVLSIALKIMGSMSWEQMGVALISMTVGLGALVAAVNLLPKDTLRRSAGMTGLAMAMIVLGAALKIMATMSWDDIGRSLATLAGSLAILSGALALMKKSIPGALAMMIVAPALIVLAGAMKIMATMSWDEIGRGLVALAGSLAILSGALALMKKGIAGALAMTIIAPALIVMATALKIMGSMSWEEIARGLVVVAGAFAVIGVAALLLKPLVGTILALSVSLALLGVACAAIGTGIFALGAGLLLIEAAGSGAALALVAIVSSLISLIPFFIEQVGVGIIALCDVIAGGATSICAAATAIILALVDALVQSVPAIAEGALVLVEELLVSLVNHAPAIINSLFDFVIILLEGIAARLPELIQAGVDVLMAFFSGVVEALKSVDIGTFIDGIVAAGVLAGLVYALAGVAALIPAAMVGVLGLGAIVVELSALFIALGALAELCGGLEGFLDKGISLMVKLAEGVGQMIGAFIGGIAEQLAASLPAIGLSLSKFAINAADFIEIMRTVDGAVLAGVGIMAAAVLAFTAVDLINGIVSFLSGGSSFADLGIELSQFMRNSEYFIQKSAELDPRVMDGVKTLAEAIKVLCSANMLDTIVGWLGGESSLSKFGSELGEFGKSLKGFVQSIGTFGDEQVKTVDCAGRAVKSLAGAAKEIPRTGGLWQGIVGEQSLAKFGSDLGSLGTNLKLFVKNLGTFDDDKVKTVTCACGAITSLAKAAKELPREGGIWQKLVGEQSLATFASSLEPLAKGITGYAKALGPEVESKAGAIQATGTAIEALATAADTCKTTSWDNFVGNTNSIVQLSEHLPTLGAAVGEFAAAVSEHTTEESANAIKGVGDVMNAIMTISKDTSKEQYDNAITEHVRDLANRLKTFGQHLNSFMDEVAKFANVDDLTGKLETLRKNVNEVLDAIKNLNFSETRLKGTDAFGQLVKDMETIATNMATSFENKAKSSSVRDTVECGMHSMMTSMHNAFTNDHNTAQTITNTKTKAGKIGVEVATALYNDDVGSAAETAGKNVVTGFANGIRNNKSLASDAGSELGKAALDAAKAALDQHSPSKEMYKVGDFAGQGFVNALDDYADKAYESGGYMADSARRGLSGAIAKVASLVESGIDAQPTIRPVLDLSNVESGTAAIGSMLSGRRTLSIDARTARMTAAVMSGYQNGGNSDVVSAIKGLSKDISGMRGDTYNVGGVTYGSDSDVANAVQTLVRAVRVERRS